MRIYDMPLLLHHTPHLPIFSRQTLQMDGVLYICHSHSVILLVILFGSTALVIAWLRRDRRLDTIPGPKGFPLIGIGHRLPPKAPAVFRKWAIEDGDIFKIRVGWHNLVVINIPEAIGKF